MLNQEQINDIELKLTAQSPINVDNNLKIYAPTLREIISVGEEKHNMILSSILFDKKNIENESFKDQDNFYVMCLCYVHDENFKHMFEDGIKLYFKKEAYLVELNGDVFFCLDEYFYPDEIENHSIINKDNFRYIQDIVKIMNRIVIDQESEYKPANSAAQKMIELIKKNKAKQPKKKESINLQSIISGVAWKSNNLNINNIFDINYFQLIDGYNRLDNIDNYNHILTGIYTGNVDSKSIKMSDISWAKILKQ